MPALLSCLILLLIAPRLRAATPDLPPLNTANWIWSAPQDDTCELRKTIVLDRAPVRATLLITADNGYEAYLNGTRIGSALGASEDVWKTVKRHDLVSQLTRGRNILGIRGRDLGGERGVIAALRIEFKDHSTVELVTDASWHTSTNGHPADYSHPEFVEGADWSDARIVAPMGSAPWGTVAWQPRKAATKNPAPDPGVTSPAPNFNWPGPVVFLGADCSVYVPQRGDAWGVAFRVNDWARAYTEFDLPCPSKIGRKLFILDPGPTSKPRLRIDAGSGAIGSPSASFDGQSLLVAMAQSGEKFFHIYRIPIHGGDPKRLTDGPFHDIDPVELPDGRIAFTSTRIGTFEEYHQPPSRALFRMNPDGSAIHPISSTLIFDNEPKVMADGRIVFIRTDNFFDRGKVETQLHVMRPDGTDGLLEIGANVGAQYGSRLRNFGYGSPAPLPDGRLAFISNRGSFIAAPGGREADFQSLPGKFGDLSPLPDGRLLATVLVPDGSKMRSEILATIDPQNGQVTRIHESSNGAIHSPVSLQSRPRPPVIPDYVEAERGPQPGATGFLFCQDARFTTKSKAGWDRVRAIRVLGAIPLTIRSSHSHIVHVGNETVELGTVPLAPDGSFFVEVPADVPLAIQAVDAEGRSELNEMSWIYVRPGERRSCIGCHQPRQSTPALDGTQALALYTQPVKLTGQGDPRRFRGNNPGVTGLMDLQFDRFREIASINQHNLRSDPNASGPTELANWISQLGDPNPARVLSAAQRLAHAHTHQAAPALARALQNPSRETRIAAAIALSACGTRDSIAALIPKLDDSDPVLSQAAAVALENLTAHSEPPPTSTAEPRSAAWQRWLANHPWDQLEQELLTQLNAPTIPRDHTEPAPNPRGVIVALGHIGGPASAHSLRTWLSTQAARNPYPKFEKDNRTDTFTFSAESPLNPRTLREAARSLGQLADPNTIPFLTQLLPAQLNPTTGNLFLSESILESLGTIGTRDAETLLLQTFAQLGNYWDYVGWFSDHPALYACHASPIHGRIIASLDALGSTQAAPIVPALIQSVPTDPDRALLPDNDDYETLVGRLIRRSTRANDVIETCLAILGDREARPVEDIRNALSTTHAAWAGHPGPENRASQILSLTVRNPDLEPRVRAAFIRFLNRPEEKVVRELGNPGSTPIRHWTLFYLGRTLGQLASPHSVDTLLSTLGNKLNEARHGRPDPAEPEIHFLQLEYTPCWRATAAWALGQIHDRRATPTLIATVANLDNAVDVRHAAAKALLELADPASLPALSKLASSYPEVSTRRVLLHACQAAGAPAPTPTPTHHASIP